MRCALLLAVALLAGACRGGDGEAQRAQARPAAAVPPAAADYGRSDPLPGRALVRFVGAARRGDAAAMWALLSDETRASLAGSRARFRDGAARELEDGLGTLSRPRVILSRALPGGKWGIAAVAGERTVEGEREHFAYGAAFLRQETRWRLELGGALIAGLEPEPLAVTTSPVRVAVNASVSGRLQTFLLWLDGRPLPVRRTSSGVFTASFAAQAAGLGPGLHRLVAFVATADTAAAVAWPFYVER